jgi:selenocysteine lyase/cysteine desulfurase
MTTRWHDLFDADPGYLNTASLGVPPRVAVDAMDEVLAGWRRGRLQPPDFDDYVNRSRIAWASLSGVDPGTVATGATVSSMVGLIAAALPDRARVLVAEGDFTSVTFPFLAQHTREVQVIEAPLANLIDTIDDSIDLVAVSVVQSSDGRVLDVESVVGAAAEHGAQVLLDTTQSCGWLPLDCSRVDYTVCGAYKWLLSPRGTAFMSIRPEHLDSLIPHAAGWYAGEDIWSSIYGSPLRLAKDARRFDISPAWFCWVGAAHALELLAAIGTTEIQSHNLCLANAFLSGLGLPATDSAIVAVSIPDAAPRLADAGIATATRAGQVRASFHLYNTADDVQAALAALGTGLA